MANTGFKNPSTVVLYPGSGTNVTSWSSPLKGRTNDNTYASFQYTGGNIVKSYQEVLIDGKYTFNFLNFGSSKSYVYVGSSTNTLNTTLTSVDVNDSQFAVEIKIYDNSPGTEYTSPTLGFENFGFNLPDLTYVTGIQFGMGARVSGATFELDYVDMKLWYQKSDTTQPTLAGRTLAGRIGEQHRPKIAIV